MGQKFACELDYGVLSLLEVAAVEFYGIVRVKAELYRLALGVVHGDGRETHHPSVGQRAAEGHAAAAAGMVAHELDVRQGFHVHGELVGGTEDVAVG